MLRRFQQVCSYVAFLAGLAAFTYASAAPGAAAWRLNHRYEIRPAKSPQIISGAALSPNGRHLAIEINWGVVAPDGTVSRIVDELQLWDVDNEKELAKTELASRPDQSPGKLVGCSSRFTRFTSDGNEILVCDGRNLQLLNAHSLALIRKVHLRLPILPGDSTSNLGIDEMELTRDGKRVAVALSHDRGGAVRIYSLTTGRLIREWSYEGINVGSTGRRLAWSPDGRYVALSVYPAIPGQRLPRAATTILIYESHSGRLVQAVRTDYVAGPVAFASSSLLVTGSLETALGNHCGDAIEEWNSNDGKLVGKFTSSPYGPRYHLSVSGNGRVLVGYVAKERRVDGFIHEVVQRFQVWDVSTRNPLYLSKPIPLSPIGWRSTRVESDAAGHRVLVWKPTREPLFVYDLHPSTE